MNWASTTNDALQLDKYLSSLSMLIEKELDQLVIDKGEPYSQLFAAGRYSLLSGGKRIRPILALATAESLGCEPTEGLRAACALEFVHTYSLIHDDLPCMDNDDYRRGKPSLHRAFSDGHAVLTGDFLLTYAFEVLATDSNLTAEQKVELIRLLSQGSGGHGMIAGQVLDIEAEKNVLSLEQLQQVHRLKTGALITAAVLFGAVIGNADAIQTEHLKGFAEDIGLAFQIIDDVLDVAGGLKKEGLPSSDIKNHKTTYVSLVGLTKAQEMAEKCYLSAIGHLSKLHFETTRLKELAQVIVTRKG